MVLLATLCLFLQSDAASSGAQALEAKDYQAAITHLKAALEKDPKDYRSHFNIGLAYSLSGKVAEAEDHYKKTLELQPGLYEAQINLGMLLLASAPAKSLTYLRLARESKPDAFGPAYFLGEALLRVGKPEEAEQHLLVAVQKDSKAADAWAALGMSQLKQVKLPEAEASLRTAMGLDAAHKAALFELANLLLEQKQTDKAISILEAFPDDIVARDRLGEILLNAGRPAEAVPHLEFVVQKQPETRRIVQLASAYVRSERRSDALPLLQKALLQAPDDVEVRMLYGRTLREERNFADAAKQFTQVIRGNPSLQDAWSELAGVQYLLELYPEALGSLDRAKALGPERVGHLYLRSIILDGLRQYKPAMEEYQRFLSVADGKFPDEEFKARQRIRIIQKMLSKR